MPSHMELSVSLLPGAQYTSRSEALPFLYRVDFKESMAILAPLDINSCLLIHTEDPEIFVGGSCSILRVHRSALQVGPSLPLEDVVDALADEEDRGILVPGWYELHAEVTVFVGEQSASAKACSLRSFMRLELT